MLGNGLTVIRLDRDATLYYLSDLIEVEQLVYEKRGRLYSTEKWDESQFLLDIPGKFETSWAVVKGDKLIAFLICSTPYPEMNHVHRVAVHPLYAGRKIGRKLMIKAYLEWKNMRQYKTITAIIREDHRLSMPFARLLGARIADKAFMSRFFEGLGRKNVQLFDEHFEDEYGVRYVLIFIQK
ncbi:GNAT family N-acetyltransferase [Paenibacillus abyssi]|uniref:N-acetyltransferase domain-containing protein n=1 Tax=Paenibacillus abyssi TaxID=1340531 RepID=A0A917FYE4_9BACL|nr:GNAT family N-acetyltransferase [Paenibacillus abyssi]GGG14074.1 hypothetical protein GCM10010916_33720 [Paenibacillus abyssi]